MCLSKLCSLLQRRVGIAPSEHSPVPATHFTARCKRRQHARRPGCEQAGANHLQWHSARSGQAGDRRLVGNSRQSGGAAQHVGCRCCFQATPAYSGMPSRVSVWAGNNMNARVCPRGPVDSRGCAMCHGLGCKMVPNTCSQDMVSPTWHQRRPPFSSAHRLPSRCWTASKPAAPRRTLRWRRSSSRLPASARMRGTTHVRQGQISQSLPGRGTSMHHLRGRWRKLLEWQVDSSGSGLVTHRALRLRSRNMFAASECHLGARLPCRVSSLLPTRSATVPTFGCHPTARRRHRCRCREYRRRSGPAGMRVLFVAGPACCMLLVAFHPLLEHVSEGVTEAALICR